MMPSTKSSSKPKASYSFEAIGTHWDIEPFQPVKRAEQLWAAVRERIARFDATYSRFRADSWLMRASQRPGVYTLPDDARPLFDLYQQLYHLTSGKVTPLVGSLLSEAGYNADYSLQPGELHTPPTWNEALNYNFPHLTIKQPVELDIGAAGKGYLVDIVAGQLQGYGIQNFLVNAGGDMLHKGQAALEIALEHPADPTLAIGVAWLKQQALCGSAGNRRAWAQFHHIIDPQTLESPTKVLAAWVSADTALLADALTTALFFVPAQQLKARYTFEYALVRDDGSLSYSAGFPATFFR